MNWTSEAIKRQVEIASILSDFVELKRKGNNFVCRCPFHDDKTPSLYVNPKKAVWNCLGCSSGGDVFDFVMKASRCGFNEAKTFVLEKSGLVRTGNLYAVNEHTMQFYQSKLPSNQHAQVYLRSRGIQTRTWHDLKLGAADDAWNHLYKHLKEHFPTHLLLKSGLVRKGEHGYFDVFRKRIMVPIFDGQGRVIGFGGRAYDKGSACKHLNTKNNEIFQKDSACYNLNRTTPGRPLLVVEGYFDTFAVHQAGFKNVVAVQTNRISPAQAEQIASKHKQVVICFDNGPSGTMNLEGSLKNLSNHGTTVKVAKLSDMDPARTLLEKGRSAFFEVLKRAEYNRNNISIQLSGYTLFGS